MRKFFILFFVLIFLSCFSVYGQWVVVDAGLNALMAIAEVDRAIAYAQMIANNVEQIMHTVTMIGHLENQVKMTMHNLKSAEDIKDWDDFVSWYNRQLYMERRAISMFENTKVSFGNKDYHFMDIAGMADGITRQHTEFWENEFSEPQRRAMWIELGLTPSNYAYRKTFQQKLNKLSEESLFGTEIQNDWYVRNMQRNRERQLKLSEDKFADEGSALGDKEIQMMQLESSMENNKLLNDIAMQNAASLEMQASQYYLEQTPYDAPLLLDFPEDGFGSLNILSY